jgi:hypothetical protein
MLEFNVLLFQDVDAALCRAHYQLGTEMKTESIVIEIQKMEVSQ